MAKQETLSTLARLGLLLSLAAAVAAPIQAATPGLPFSEDFSDTVLRDPELTDADWSTDQGALLLPEPDPLSQPFGPDSAGTAISPDQDPTTDVALGDMDGDGDLDLVVSNCYQVTKLYLNNGTADPFGDAAGRVISSDMDTTRTLALGDLDGDGDLDLLVGNGADQDGVPNKLYLNNGTADPFAGVSGREISTSVDWTKAVALRDMDRDGDLDLVTADFDQITRLYLNNGTADPFAGVIGRPISLDSDHTKGMALGDVDGDGDLDVVIGNEGQVDRLYLNNGTADPFDGVLGSDISAGLDVTLALALGDMDNDGDIDLVSGIGDMPNKLYLNNGTAAPFSGTLGITITTDAGWTRDLGLGDLDGDGDLDLVTGNDGQVNKLYLNNGTAAPFSGTVGITITADTMTRTRGLALGDVDWDGDLDLVTGNYLQVNQLYLNEGSAASLSNAASAAATATFHTAHGRATSLRVDTETGRIPSATLIPTATLPANTGVTYWLSNNGGLRWFQVRPGVSFWFPTVGADLRWRAELHSLSPALTPRVDQIRITMDLHLHFLPLVTRERLE